MSLAALANTLEGDLGGRREPPGPNVFIPSRYPHTYGYDWLRGETREGHKYSRAEMAGITRSFASNYGVDRGRLVTIFADRYLAKYNIQKHD